MVLLKREEYEAGILLQINLLSSAEKSEDIMDEAEKKYFKANSTRKAEQWAIQNAYDRGLISRPLRGFHQKNIQTLRRLKEISLKIDSMIYAESNDDLNVSIQRVADKLSVLNITAVSELYRLYNFNQTQILTLQAEELRQKMSLQLIT